MDFQWHYLSGTFGTLLPQLFPLGTQESLSEQKHVMKQNYLQKIAITKILFSYFHPDPQFKLALVQN